MSVSVVLTQGMLLPCRAVLDGLACSACRVVHGGVRVACVGPYSPSHLPSYTYANHTNIYSLGGLGVVRVGHGARVGRVGYCCDSVSVSCLYTPCRVRS